MTRNGVVCLGAKEQSIASTQPIDTEMIVVATVKISVVTSVLRKAGSEKSLM